MQCEVTFYLDKKLEQLNVTIKIYNDMLKSLKDKYPIDCENIENGRPIYCLNIDEVKELIEKIVSSCK